MSKQEIIARRTLAGAKYMTENDCTIRDVAKALKVSKSTIHKDLTERLRSIDRNKYKLVNEIIQRNKEERAIRGGLSTRKKWEGVRRDII